MGKHLLSKHIKLFVICAIFGYRGIFGQVEVEWVFVKGDTFQLGDTGKWGSKDEKPAHSVILTDFYISKYEITFSQYDVFCKSTDIDKPNDEGWGRGNRPVINVTWINAIAFCDWLSKKTGKKIRLPTEAEWEYASKGGCLSKKYDYSGDNNIKKVACD